MQISQRLLQGDENQTIKTNHGISARRSYDM